MTQDDEHSERACEHDAYDAASYTINGWWIRLPPTALIFDKEGRFIEGTSTGRVGIFIHEYVHYLQNVATIAGFNQLVLEVQLAAIFSQTFRELGRSSGDVVLDEEQRRRLHEVQSFHPYLRAPAKVSVPGPSTLTKIRVTRMDAVPSPEVLVGEVLHTRMQMRIGATLEYANADPDEVTFPLSLAALEEGLAFELERMFVTRAGGKPMPVSPNPYSIVREVASFAWPDIDDLALIRCGLAALQTGDPPFEFCRLLMSKTDPTAESVSRTVLEAMPHVRTALAESVRIFGTRGLASEGLRSIALTMERALERRCTEPFFELDLLPDVASGLTRHEELLAELLPCEVLVAQDDLRERIGRDGILTFGGDDRNPRIASDGRRGWQALMHALRQHTRAGIDGFHATPSARPSPCPFYTACSLAPRTASESRCGTAPWTNFERGGTAHCWYVSGFLGLSANIGDLRPLDTSKK